MTFIDVLIIGSLVIAVVFSVVAAIFNLLTLKMLKDMTRRK
jgi:hypothetical protein